MEEKIYKGDSSTSDSNITSEVSKIALGSHLPDMLVNTVYGTINLSFFKKHRLLLYFYPKDDTPGCTIQANDFTEYHQEFLNADTQIVGISRDSISSHKKFSTKFKLSINLISDETEELCKLFEVIKKKNMYGKVVFGIERSSFLFNKEGFLIKEWRKVSPAGHAKEVLEFIKQE